MTVRVWDGGAVLNDKWSRSDNWVNGAPQEFDELVFPEGTISIFDRSTNNDFPAGTTFNKITFEGNNYKLKGNPIVLGSGGLLQQPSIALTNQKVENHIEFGITLSTASTLIDVQQGPAQSISGLFLDGGLGGMGGITKEGEAILHFAGSNNNSYSGTTRVNAGLLYLEKEGGAPAIPGPLFIEDLITNVSSAEVDSFGSNQLSDTAAVTINNAGKLNLVNSFDTIGPLTLNGGLVLASGKLTVNGDVVCTSRPGSQIGGNLGLGNPVNKFTVDGTGSLRVSAAISGTGQLVKSGAGDLLFAGFASNTYSGETRVNEGRLLLDATAGATAIAGPLVVGDGLGSDVVILNSANQISDASAVRVNSSGLLDLTDSADTIGPLTFEGGRVTSLFNAVLKLNGILATLASDSQARIDGGQLDLGSASRLVNVADGPPTADLVITAKIIGNNSGLDKINSGTLFLANVNEQGQPTKLNGGSLLVNGNHAGVSIIVNRGVLGGIGTIGGVSMNGGTIDPGLSPGLLTASTLTATSDAAFRFEINGANQGTQFDQLRVTNVNVFGNSLDLSGNPKLNVVLGGGFTPALGTPFKIVDIAPGRPPANGAFKSLQGTLLNEGAPLTVSGQTFTISYVGGDGNDVVLTRNDPPAFQNRSVTSAVPEGGIATLKGTITEPNAGDTFFLDVIWGDGTPQETFTFPPGSPQNVSVTHQYLDDNPSNTPADLKTIQLLWRDQHGGSNKATLPIIVYNLAPTLSNLAFSSPAVPGQSVTLGGRINDASIRDTFTLYINWGDGSALEIRAFAAGTTDFTLTHRFARAGNYTTTLIVRDDDFGFNAATSTVTVKAPVAVSAAKSPSGGKAAAAAGLDPAAVNAIFTLDPLALEPLSRGRKR